MTLISCELISNVLLNVIIIIPVNSLVFKCEEFVWNTFFKMFIYLGCKKLQTTAMFTCKC